MNREERLTKIGYHLIEVIRLGNQHGDLDTLRKLIKADMEEEILQELLV